jgi:hypothetical protein
VQLLLGQFEEDSLATIQVIQCNRTGVDWDLAGYLRAWL